jgi:hypothetical protein
MRGIVIGEDSNSKRKEMTIKSKKINMNNNARKSKTTRSIPEQSTYKSNLLEPKILLRIIAIFLLIDIFAFQKELSGVLVAILVDIPLLLFAIVNFTWAQRKEFPDFHPFFGFTGMLDEKLKTSFAYITCIMCIIFAILIAVTFPFIHIN